MTARPFRAILTAAALTAAAAATPPMAQEGGALALARTPEVQAALDRLVFARTQLALYELSALGLPQEKQAAARRIIDAEWAHAKAEFEAVYANHFLRSLSADEIDTLLDFFADAKLQGLLARYRAAEDEVTREISRIVEDTSTAVDRRIAREVVQ